MTGDGQCSLPIAGERDRCRGEVHRDRYRWEERELVDDGLVVPTGIPVAHHRGCPRSVTRRKGDRETVADRSGRRFCPACDLERIEGSDPNAPSLCLMGHTDVVPVTAAGWQADLGSGKCTAGP